MCVILYYIFITINFTLSERNSELLLKGIPFLISMKGGSCVTRKGALRKFIQSTALQYWSDDDADAAAAAAAAADDDDDNDKGG